MMLDEYQRTHLAQLCADHWKDSLIVVSASDEEDNNKDDAPADAETQEPDPESEFDNDIDKAVFPETFTDMDIDDETAEEINTRDHIIKEEIKDGQFRPSALAADILEQQKPTADREVNLPPDNPEDFDETESLTYDEWMEEAEEKELAREIGQEKAAANAEYERDQADNGNTGYVSVPLNFLYNMMERLIARIEYRVVETAAEVDGQDVKPDTEAVAEVSEDGTANIDNILQITIQILKVDANNRAIRLGNAEFQLTKVQSLETTNQVTEGRYDETGTTSNANDDTKGTLQFTGITPGYYYLHETKSPDGYVMTEKTGWHFQVDENGIMQGVGDLTSDGTFQYVDAKSMTVENTPGAALPSTGGPGTNMIYFLGIVLTGLTGGGLLMKRRRKNKELFQRKQKNTG